MKKYPRVYLYEIKEVLSKGLSKNYVVKTDRQHPYTVLRVGRITFFLANRVEHQNEPKRPQSGGRLGSFWCSTRPSADTGTDYNQQQERNQTATFQFGVQLVYSCRLKSVPSDGG